MSAIRFRAPLAAVACACLSATLALAQTPAKSPPKPAARAAAATGPWAKVPALPTGCFENVAENQPDPFYAKLEAAKEAIAADRDRQAEVNAKIEEDFRNIDPMEKAQRMQQWMMSNPQEAMAYMQGVQAAPAQGQADEQAFQQQVVANEANWAALKKSYDDTRIAAYAPIEVRRKALAGRTGYKYDASPEQLVEPRMNSYYETGTSDADWNEAERISAALDGAYKALCPQWWGASGKFHAYLKGQQDWYATKRVAYLEKQDGPKLQQYAIMNTPAASYRSTAPEQAALEYLDVVYKVIGERDTASRCDNPRSCDGTYP